MLKQPCLEKVGDRFGKLASTTRGRCDTCRRARGNVSCRHDHSGSSHRTSGSNHARMQVAGIVRHVITRCVGAGIGYARVEVTTACCCRMRWHARRCDRHRAIGSFDTWWRVRASMGRSIGVVGIVGVSTFATAAIGTDGPVVVLVHFWILNAFASKVETTVRVERLRVCMWVCLWTQPVASVTCF